MSKGSIAAYAGVFLFVISMVSIGYQPPQQLTVLADAASTSTQTTESMNTVNDLVATNVAANIAQTANLPVAANVSNRSQSMEAESLLVKSEDTVVSKPQIVEPTASNREVSTYVAVAGDSVQTIAEKYNISAETVKWANNLDSDAVPAGAQIKILPVDGLIYTAKDGDTAQSIAEKYGATSAELVAFNDLEIKGVTAGDQIIIPSGILPETDRPGYVAPTTTSSSSSGSYNYSGGSASSFAGSASVGNKYAFGNCTWYVYERRAQLGRPVGSFWGNASTWAAYARASGYTVNGTPAPGAIMATGSGYGGYGHVAVVESVDEGNSITITEMNAYRFGGGFNIVGRGQISWGEAVNGYFQYIH